MGPTICLPKGFALLGAIFAVSIMAAMSIGLPILFAANQVTRTQQLHKAQAYYAARAGFEYTMRQINIEDDPDLILGLNFGGESLTVTRTGGKINVTGAKGGASSTHSIFDPNPPSFAKCLNVDGSAANLNQSEKKMLGVVFNRVVSTPVKCNYSITIDSMTVSWTPDVGGYKLKHISIENNLVFLDAIGLTSGSTFDFSTPHTMTDSSSQDLTHFQWNNLGTNPTITIIFNMSDGSSKTVVLTIS